MNKIYTKTGDKGKTSLFSGQRVLKSNSRVDAYGTIDELNSVIGTARAQLNRSSKDLIVVDDVLKTVQNDLLAIGSYLANPEAKVPVFLKKQVTAYEETIDDLTAKLPKLRNFILPSGSVAGSQLHVARTISRRAERRVVFLLQETEIDDSVIMYMNRLSDLLFTLARYVNYIEKKPETIWSSD